MESREDRLRNQIALGWVMESLVVVIMLVFMTITSILVDESIGTSLRRDPGRAGLGILTYIFAIYLLMPIYVYLVHGLKIRVFRWIAVGLAFLAFVYFLMHHLGHWQYGDRPYFTTHVLDLLLHVISLWVIVNSVRWAIYPKTETKAEGT